MALAELKNSYAVKPLFDASTAVASLDNIHKSILLSLFVYK